MGRGRSHGTGDVARSGYGAPHRDLCSTRSGMSENGSKVAMRACDAGGEHVR